MVHEHQQERLIGATCLPIGSYVLLVSLNGDPSPDPRPPEVARSCPKIAIFSKSMNLQNDQVLTGKGGLMGVPGDRTGDHHWSGVHKTEEK